MIPATVNLYEHYNGDTWDGMAVGPVKFNTGTTEVPVLIPPSHAVTSCRMHFRAKTVEDVDDGTLGYEFVSTEATGKGLITIVDAAQWRFAILPQMLPLAAGKWLYDFECTDTTGAVMTLYKGQIKVVQDQSR